jgi:hypothetical protein
MPDKQDPLTPPEDDALAEAGSAVGRIVLGAVPMVGAALSEALGMIVNAPLQERVQTWRQEVMRRILALEERNVLSTSNLEGDQDFASAVIDAQMAVLRSNSEEKKKALANAVINVALRRGPEEDRRQMFMNYISDLTPWHLRILILLNDPVAISKTVGVDMSNIMAGSFSNLLERVYPELAGRREFYDQIAGDLASRGLSSNFGIHTMMTGSGIMAKRTTETGDEFIRFITAPQELA